MSENGVPFCVSGAHPKKGAIMKCLVTALALLASPIAAQPSCAPFSTIDGHLSEKYGETVQATGAINGGVAMLVYANTQTGSWTVVIVQPNGLACMRAAGADYAYPAMPSGEPA